MALDGMPLPADHKIWIAYQKEKNKIEQLNNDLRSTIAGIYSTNELISIAKWIAFIIMAIVYPLRGLYLLLKWAIKTLRV